MASANELQLYGTIMRLVDEVSYEESSNHEDVRDSLVKCDAVAGGTRCRSLSGDLTIYDLHKRCY